MKKTALILLSAILAMGVQAAPRSLDAARKIAEAQAQKLGRTVASVQNARTQNVASDAEQPYYVFNNTDNKGFTLVSGDDRMPEVIGYADEGSFQSENIPDGLKFYLECYEQTYRAVVSGGESAARSVARKAVAKTAIIPMVKCHWAQNEPYNLNTPIIDGQRTLTGCVATALAQILYYHKNLDVQMVDIPGYGNIPSITGNRVYKWDKMLETYAEGYTPEQAAAVSELMYDCGVALNMSYGTSVSTTYSQNIPNILKYFGMADGAKAVNASDYKTTDDWLAVLDNELENKRPVVVWGYSSTCGGHSFLSSGRNDSGLYHINWGWGNNSWTAEGYYDMTVLAPGLPDDEGYHNNCGLVIGIQRAGGNVAAVQRMKLVIQQVNTAFAKYVSGTAPGFIDTEAYKTVQNAIAEANSIVASSGSGLTGEEIDAKTLALKTMVENLAEQAVPLTGGYYYVKSTKTASGTNYALREVLGVRNAELFKAEASYIWKLGYDEKSGAYTFQNASYIPEGADPYADEMCIRPQSYSGATVYYTLRAADGESDYLSASGTTTWTLEAVDDATAQSLIDATYEEYRYAALKNKVEPLLAKANSALANIAKDAEQKAECQAETEALQKVVDNRPATYTDEYYMQLLVAYSALAAKYVDSNILQDYCNNYKTLRKNLVKGRGEGTNDQYKVALFEAALIALRDSLNSGSAMNVATMKALRDELFDTYDAAVLSYRPYTGKVNPEPGTPQYQLDVLIDMADSICNSGMAEVTKTGLAKTVSLASKYSSPFTDPEGGKVTILLNGATGETWKSMEADTVPTCYHYVQMTLNSAYEGVAVLNTTRASNGFNQVTRFGILGSNDKENWTDVAELEIPCDRVGENKRIPFMLYSAEENGGFKYVRIYINETTSDNGWAEIAQLLVNKPGSDYTDAAAKVLTLYKAQVAAESVKEATSDDVEALRMAIKNYTGKDPMPTGIDEVQEVEKVQDVQGGTYGLTGQRLIAPRKGINIVNGKKMIY